MNDTIQNRLMKLIRQYAQYMPFESAVEKVKRTYLHRLDQHIDEAAKELNRG